MARIGVLTGPNLAKEIVQGQPAATVVAMTDAETAERLQTVFMTPTLPLPSRRISRPVSSRVIRYATGIEP